MSARARLILSTIAGTLASAIYWWCFFMVAFSITAGDYGPGAAPSSDAARTFTSVAVFAVGLGVYAVGAWFWRRMDLRIAGAGRG